MRVKNWKMFIESNSDDLKSWAYEYAKTNHEGLNSYEDACEELDYFFNFEYPDMKGKFKLFRVLQVSDISDVDKETIGEHFLHGSYIDRLNDRGFFDSIGIEFDPDEKLVLLEVVAQHDDVDWYQTIKNRLSFPREFEVTLKHQPEIINIKEIEYPKY